LSIKGLAKTECSKGSQKQTKRNELSLPEEKSHDFTRDGKKWAKKSGGGSFRGKKGREPVGKEGGLVGLICAKVRQEGLLEGGRNKYWLTLQ